MAWSEQKADLGDLQRSLPVCMTKSWFWVYSSTLVLTQKRKLSQFSVAAQNSVHSAMMRNTHLTYSSHERVQNLIFLQKNALTIELQLSQAKKQKGNPLFLPFGSISFHALQLNIHQVRGTERSLDLWPRGWWLRLRKFCFVCSAPQTFTAFYTVTVPLRRRHQSLVFRYSQEEQLKL